MNDERTPTPSAQGGRRKCQRSEIDQNRREKPKRCQRVGSKTFHINLGGIAVSVVLCSRCSVALEREQAERLAGRHPAVPQQSRSERDLQIARRAAKNPTVQRKISNRAVIPAHIKMARIEAGRRELEKVHSTWREDDFHEALIEELEAERGSDDPAWIEEELEACGINSHLLTEEYQEAKAILRSQGIRI